MTERVYMTKEGYDKVQAELQKLKFVDRHEIIAMIEEARSHGDLSENAEYHSAREKQSFIEGRIKELESALGRSEVIDVTKLSGDKVVFGAKVEIQDCDTEEIKKYQIVGQYEADLENGLISLQAPLSKLLIGKSVGDFVEMNTPMGLRTYEILNVQYG